MSYAKISVSRPAGQTAGTGGNFKDKIFVFDWDDVDSGYLRDSLGVVIPQSLVFKNGTYGIQLYGSQDTIKIGAESQGETDAEGIIQSVEFSHPGNLKEIKEFRSNWLGKSVGIIIEKCSDGTKTLYGAPCAPLRIAFKADWDKDKNNAVMTFKSAQKGPDVADYLGTLTLASVMGTVAADAQNINVAAGSGEYQLTDGSAAAIEITAITNPVDGALYTILGSGGSYPSTIEDAPFILHNGTVWTGLAGAKITFKAFKSGASSWVFIEQSRS
ncbi:MAG: hypothetical protein ACOYMF_05195, partial [Bacteroidales bacterium]